jgi:hypothetical protein
MPKRPRRLLPPMLLAGALLGGPALAADAPASFEVADHAVILEVHAVGAQVYQCQADAAGHLAWTFREPIATLIGDGKTVGRHYAGPSWALDDGGAVQGKVLASLPGAGPGDIPLLKLTVVQHQAAGALADAALVLRLNTRGGVFKGDCAAAGDLHAEPYAADYVFLR